jgi:hypothetical protein
MHREHRRIELAPLHPFELGSKPEHLVDRFWLVRCRELHDRPHSHRLEQMF